MSQYNQFMLDFYHYCGIDLRRYKRQQMERRLTTLMQRLEYSSFPEFFNAIQNNDGVLRAVMDKLTINVSEFFRNPDRWDSLTDLLTAQSGTIRAWSAACSTGEEPYTLAILLEDKISRPYHITATDLDENALAAAKLGIYKSHQMKCVPEHYLNDYFSEKDSTWQISNRYKRHIEFSRHNLLADPYPRNQDLVICRNVLIYFTDEAKAHVLSEFSKALKFGGYLFVGSTEQIFSPQTYGFKIVRPFIYQKID
ncbi:protein-glutamate O-methyltransferase CheR [Alicyclobacillus sp. SO9]|uniref:CheR family methyltransferase n=1 Tax=Alicyclobacillus sp. SO9 TaxID=2665646 RepID=UPI0018E8DE64|nr:protein-glutamate O-methyltransferase CheR [Alicyclobacillus sp. SO9]QQE76817.1 protein-glutamate O-methyltransferase CheR [Alicyclobacillus sp. SO9]